MDGPHRYSGASPKTSKGCRTSPTFEQLLQVDSPKWILATSPTLGREHSEEEDYVHHHNNNKKSVLTKVKERAKKLRFSLSKKKHEEHDDNITPSWGVSLDDDDDDDGNDDEDPEYLGAPMYESEMAPERYRETTRQYPRAVPVVSEKHVLPTTPKNDEGDHQKPICPNSYKTITESVSEKLAPAYAAVTDATQTIASKLANLTVTTSASPDIVEHSEKVSSVPKATLGTVSENRDRAAIGGNQTWDKGVSVKEYFMQKLEPGEDERALSQVITEAISPKKSTPRTMGMVDKVREAVTSLLRGDAESSSQSKTTTIKATNTRSSSTIPHFTNEVVEEENLGRILQAN